MTPSLYRPLKRILFHFQFCGGGGSFSEVLSSSYELTLSEYGEDNEAASLLALGEPASSHCPPSPHQHQAHGHWPSIFPTPDNSTLLISEKK